MADWIRDVPQMSTIECDCIISGAGLTCVQGCEKFFPLPRSSQLIELFRMSVIKRAKITRVGLYRFPSCVDFAVACRAR